MSELPVEVTVRRERTHTEILGNGKRIYVGRDSAAIGWLTRSGYSREWGDNESEVWVRNLDCDH